MKRLSSLLAIAYATLSSVAVGNAAPSFRVEASSSSVFVSGWGIYGPGHYLPRYTGAIRHFSDFLQN